jgi:hypothetical protein
MTGTSRRPRAPPANRGRCEPGGRPVAEDPPRARAPRPPPAPGRVAGVESAGRRPRSRQAILPFPASGGRPSRVRREVGPKSGGTAPLPRRPDAFARGAVRRAPTRVVTPRSRPCPTVPPPLRARPERRPRSPSSSARARVLARRRRVPPLAGQAGAAWALGLLRGAAHRQRQARRAPRDQPRVQGPVPALQDDAGPPRHPQGRLGHARPAGRDRHRAAARVQEQAGGRGLRHRALQRPVPRLRLREHPGLERDDRAHRLLGRPRGGLRHLRPRLRRVVLVDHPAAVAARPADRGLQDHLALAVVEHHPRLARGGARLPRGRARPQRLPRLPGRTADLVARGLVDAGETREAAFLAWTTTPWTLAANTGLAVHPDATYAVVEGPRASGPGGDAGTKLFVLAESPRAGGLRRPPAPRPGDLRRPRPGRRPLPTAAARASRRRRRARTGRLARRGRRLRHARRRHRRRAPRPRLRRPRGGPPPRPADALVGRPRRPGDGGGGPPRRPRGRPGPYTGQWFKDADEAIARDLEERGLMFDRGVIRHTYPFNWRDDSR